MGDVATGDTGMRGVVHAVGRMFLWDTWRCGSVCPQFEETL